VRLLLVFLATAVFLGCRDALAWQQGREITRTWPLLAAAAVVAAGFLTQRLLA
jgi:hypothetical protein